MDDATARQHRGRAGSRGLSAEQMGALRQRALRAAREDGAAMWQPLAWAGLVLALSAAVILILVTLGRGFAAPFAVMVGLFGVIAALSVHVSARNKLIDPYLRQLLEQGERTYCRACGYNLIGSAHADEWCPECGAYISRTLLTGDGTAPPLILRSGERPGRLTLVSGVEVDPELLERIVTGQAGPVRRRMQALNLLGFGVATVVSSIALALITDFELTPGSAFVLLPVAAFAGWMLVQHRVRDRIIVRRVRAELCARGVPVCVACGRYRDPERTEPADPCPGCGMRASPAPPIS